MHLRDDDAMDAAGVLGEDEFEQLRTAVDERFAQAATFAEWSDSLKEARRFALDQRGEECGLAGIARVERLLGGAGAAGDLAHAGALEALFQKDFGGDVEQALGAGCAPLRRAAGRGRFPFAGGGFAGCLTRGFSLSWKQA